MRNTIGIIMAGGKGTRMSPLTEAISKHLLPIYDKPMIYYSLSTLMITEIRDVLIIGSEKDILSYTELFGNGSKIGMNINYEVQIEPKGIPEAFLIGEKFIGKNNVCLILGDNFFYGNGLSNKLINIKNNNKGATLVAFEVQNPNDYGVIKFNKKKIISIEEKPKKFVSNYAVTGLYFYDNNAVTYSKSLKPSKRNELEITDLNKIYLNKKNLYLEVLERGYTWMDTGDPKNLLKAAQFVNIIEERQGLKIACIEEIAYRNKWINKRELIKISKMINNSNYRGYLKKILIS